MLAIPEHLSRLHVSAVPSALAVSNAEVSQAFVAGVQVALVVFGVLDVADPVGVRLVAQVVELGLLGCGLCLRLLVLQELLFELLLVVGLQLLLHLRFALLELLQRLLLQSLPQSLLPLLQLFSEASLQLHFLPLQLFGTLLQFGLHPSMVCPGALHVQHLHVLALL